MKGERTRAIHLGEDPLETQHGDIVPPIHVAVTFAKKSVRDVESGYVYSRTSNPTRDVLERKLAGLERGKCGFAFSSGLAAEATILLSILRSGDKIVALDDLYGGTKRLFRVLEGRFGVRVRYVDATNLHALEKAVGEGARIVWIETPSNPLLKIVDIREAARIAHESGAFLVVDNTFATPVFQKPLTLGADIVIHSATKYLSGHSDILAGAAVSVEEELCEGIGFMQNALGAVLSPHDSWLLLRSIKTLPARMRIHESNAKTIAEWLERDDRVERVYYPGLSSHPGHDVARRQMAGYSGMVSFEIKGGPEVAVRFVESLRLFHLAESLGGVESLVEIPSLMTHASVPREERLRLGIGDSLIRMSVGIEDVEDLISDIETALKRAFEQ